VCGNEELLRGPANPPAGAVVVPAGDNSTVEWTRDATTFWFAPGVHTLGPGEFDQIIPGRNSTFIGAPGAILDGQRRNLYAFTQQAPNVRVAFLTIRGFGRGADNHNEGVVNHDAGDGWVIEHNTVVDNDGAGVFVGDGNVVRNNCLQDNTASTDSPCTSPTASSM
jgi:parallel beta-helix repeat protein